MLYLCIESIFFFDSILYDEYRVYDAGGRGRIYFWFVGICASYCVDGSWNCRFVEVHQQKIVFSANRHQAFFLFWIVFWFKKIGGVYPFTMGICKGCAMFHWGIRPLY